MSESIPLVHPATTVPASTIPARVTVRATDLAALTKPRVTSLVVFTTFTGFYVAAPGRLDLVALAHAVVGTWLVAGGAAALNQWRERGTDALMRRTCGRPLPAGRMHPAVAGAFGVVLAAAGTLELATRANLLAAMLALVTLAIYVGIYTPLKLRTPRALEIGAVPGALPPLIGWAAARGSLSGDVLALFAILFLWQMPHFLAIAWLYREDYARGGYRVLPVVDRSGSKTAAQAAVYSVALVAVSLLPFLVRLAGVVYLAGVAALGAWLLVVAMRFALTPSRAAARRLFHLSLVYLPLVLLLLIVNPAIGR